MSRRDYRTAPGVSTPGHPENRAPPSQGAAKSSSCPCSSLCSKSGVGLANCWSTAPSTELHPVLGLAVLKGPQKFVEDLVRHSRTENASLSPPSGRCPFYPYPGLKPRAESCSPFGTKSVPFGTSSTSLVGTIDLSKREIRVY